MDTKLLMTADERSAIIMRCNTWAYNFLVFALLIDIMYRALVWQEAAWDLFALLFASGVVSLMYSARHNVLILNRKSAVIMALGAIVAAVVAFILAVSKAM
ncbi:MAG TPA: hypothetical protein VHK01_05830 [Lacipirellulaceae bacterium]|jgi:hypothetical protein|nr:hypothetical protein [Lacipirellulaceae bacterium]